MKAKLTCKHVDRYMMNGWTLGEPILLILIGMREIRRHGKSSFFHPVSNWIRTKRGRKLSVSYLTILKFIEKCISQIILKHSHLLNIYGINLARNKGSMSRVWAKISAITLRHTIIQTIYKHSKCSLCQLILRYN